MFYWGDYLAIGILLFTIGFMIGWTTCSMRDWEEQVEAKQKREILNRKLRYEQMEERYRVANAKKKESK